VTPATRAPSTSSRETPAASPSGGQWPAPRSAGELWWEQRASNVSGRRTRTAAIGSQVCLAMWRDGPPSPASESGSRSA
jgi:hypothetical protein